jgi:hypothetical protein
MRKSKIIVAVLFAAFGFAAAAVAEVGTVRTAASLMAAPYRDAKIAGPIAVETRVEIVERRGGWLRVTANDQNGWLRLHEVRLGDGKEKKGSSGFLALWNLGQTGRSGTQGAVATTGIRGLSAEQLKNAEPNTKAVKRLERYRATDEQALEHAQAAGLKPRSVPALPTPEEIGERP